MIETILFALLWAYVLLVGFFFYASVIQAWPKLKIGIKVLVAPTVALVGLIDVAFDLVIGSIIFLELPNFKRNYTFSQRCCVHFHDADWRGKVAGVFSVPLNAIVPGHIH